MSWVLKEKLIKQIRVKRIEEQTGRRERITNSSPQNACWGQKEMWLRVDRSYNQELCKAAGSYSILGETQQGMFPPGIYL